MLTIATACAYLASLSQRRLCTNSACISPIIAPP